MVSLNRILVKKKRFIYMASEAEDREFTTQLAPLEVFQNSFTKFRIYAIIKN